MDEICPPPSLIAPLSQGPPSCSSIQTTLEDVRGTVRRAVLFAHVERLYTPSIMTSGTFSLTARLPPSYGKSTVSISDGALGRTD